MKRFQKETIAILVILILGIIFQKNYINEFPSHIHAWAQSDRYAIALRFTDNNLNFFKPETFVYNHQFPYDMKVPAEETITAVDFPIHDYIPAIFMKLLNNKSPWIFRLYILIYSFFGLFFLFQFAKLITNDFLKSVFATVFAATSPVFVYYQSGFLPTIPSLANSIIGIYFYTLHLQSKKSNYFNLSIFFLTLAALSRTTFAIHLIAIFCYEFLRFIKKETRLKHKIIPVLASIISILVYFFYNVFLRNNYGSVFLNTILPATSLQHISEILETVKQNWGTQYFSPTHYITYLVLLALLIVSVLTKNVQFPKLVKQSFILTLIIFLGCILFSLLMLRQFPAHDYYFLDTFYLPVLLILIIVLSVVPNHSNKWQIGISTIIIFMISISMIKYAANSQQSRREIKSWDKTTSTINNFKNAEKFLDSLGIPSNAKMLVIDAHAPNIPFILMNRKGYAIMTINPENIENALTWNYDYIVTQNQFFLSDVYSIYPKIISKISRIWDNDKISIHQLRKDTTKQEIYEYLGLNTRIPLFEETIDFESQPNDNWNNFTATSEKHYAGKYAGILTSNEKYGLTFRGKNFPFLKDKERALLFQSYFLQNTKSNVKVVVTISENGETTFYKTVDLNAHLKKQKEWEQAIFIFNLPKIKSNDYELGLYLMNDNSEIYFDNFGFKIF